jgi:threonyl-tRNA synthetase
MSKVPYMLVIGEKEAANNVVAVRTRAGQDLGQMPIASFIDKAKQEVSARSS